MKWFRETFLPSLEERYNKNRKLWLTEKQVSVCKKYMTYSKYVRGHMFLVIGNKQYNIQISGKNGCANFYIVDSNTGFVINPNTQTDPKKENKNSIPDWLNEIRKAMETIPRAKETFPYPWTRQPKTITI